MVHLLAVGIRALVGTVGLNTGLSLLLAAMDAIGSGSLPAVIGMWPIHAGFLILGLGLAFNAQRKGMSG